MWNIIHGIARQKLFSTQNQIHRSSRQFVHPFGPLTGGMESERKTVDKKW